MNQRGEAKYQADIVIETQQEVCGAFEMPWITNIKYS
jgi:hypothetical protein